MVPGPGPSAPASPIILWAEDEASDQALIRLAVEDLSPPPTIQFANDGVDLLEALKTVRPALVVVDLSMPRMGGIQTLEAIRADPALADLRVVVFTGAEAPAEGARCRELGAQVLRKPAQFTVFRMLVHGIVSRIHRPRPASVSGRPSPVGVGPEDEPSGGPLPTTN